MQFTLFGALVALIGIWCQFGSYRRTVVTMVGLTVFGAASALDLPALGGSSITPANFFLLFVLLRLVSMRGGSAALIAEVAPRRTLFPFFLLVIWIFGSAFLLPRLFDGAVDVFSLSRSDDSDGTSPLHPTSGNLSQAVYAVGGFLVACATCAFARKPGGSRALLAALMLATTLDLGFALLDVLTAATHTGFILDVVHTASYAFLTEDELGGLKRISGSFSEASGFASYSLTLLAVNFALFVSGVKPRFTGPASLMLTGFIALSTSSAGYAGLAAVLGAFLLYAAVGLMRRRRRVVTIAAATLGAGGLAVSMVILFLPAMANVAQTVIDESLLHKATTDSAIERGSWNAQALEVFADTHWLGAGIGSTRGSNYALVLLSNLGAIGFALFVLMLLRVTLSPIAEGMHDEERAIVWAARIGVLTTLVPSLLVGTVYDLGTLFYVLIGIAASGAALTARREPAEQRPGRPMHPSNASFSSGGQR